MRKETTAMMDRNDASTPNDNPRRASKENIASVEEDMESVVCKGTFVMHDLES